jgi:hypothetical protein
MNFQGNTFYLLWGYLFVASVDLNFMSDDTLPEK